MRKAQAYVLLTAVCLTVGLVFLTHLRAQAPAAPPAREARAAVCDMQILFTEYTRAKDLLAQLNEKRQALAAEDEQRSKAIDALQAELNGLKPDSAEYEARRAQAERQQIDRAVAMQYAESDLRRQHRLLTMDMYAEISKVVAAVAQERGFNLVFYRDGALVDTDETLELLAQIRSRKLLYSDNSLDITSDVLTRLNAAYRGGTP
ncbi:MAG: OmpH family outer membrane protein [Phycisphaerae bacterium]|nr:OmpH family outer membrane protein [Phycisphaerae bacterium]